MHIETSYYVCGPNGTPINKDKPITNLADAITILEMRRDHYLIEAVARRFNNLAEIRRTYPEYFDE